MKFSSQSKTIAELKVEALARIQNVQVPNIPEVNKVVIPTGHEPQVAEFKLLTPEELHHRELIKKYGFDPFTLDNKVLNEQQRKAVELFGLEGKSGCLIGPAGTGKTTTMKAINRAATLSNRIPIIPDDEPHKYIPTGTPGIWGGSFTRIATRNLKDNFPPDLKGNVHTIHRLLEYEPKTIENITDPITGKTKTVKRFIPTRNSLRPLAAELKLFEFDESSMVGSTLYGKVIDAMPDPENTQIIFIGDLAQLPPVMDDPILGYKLLEMPVVELTEVYRHAGIIVKLANHIRMGNTIPAKELIWKWAYKPTKIPDQIKADALKEWNIEEDGSKVTIHHWKRRLEGEIGQLEALQSLGQFEPERNKYGFFPKEIRDGNYNPLKHMILIPYNVGVGCDELNNYIAQYLGFERHAVVFEIIAGREKKYLAVGDKVFFQREEAIITQILPNKLYSGKIPQKESVTLNRWGHNTVPIEDDNDPTSHHNSIDNIMASLKVSVTDDEEKKNQASHLIKAKKLVDIEEVGIETAQEYDISATGDITELLFGYALTIHKSQGSQWDKVYCVFHNSHTRNIQRELLYTAITRAKKELYVICEPETFVSGVLSQHITGNTLEEKAKFFQKKAEVKKSLIEMERDRKQAELKLFGDSK